MITIGPIQKTPWYFRLFGAPAFRRWIDYDVQEGLLWHEREQHWQYLTEEEARLFDLPGFLAGLTPAQKQQALAYRDADHHGELK